MCLVTSNPTSNPTPTRASNPSDTALATIAYTSISDTDGKYNEYLKTLQPNQAVATPPCQLSWSCARMPVGVSTLIVLFLSFLPEA